MNLALLCRRMIFAQVLLGIVAAGMAEKNPGLLLVSGAIAAMSWYLTEGPRGRFLPRWAVNAGAILATGWLAIELVLWRSHVVGAMSHFILVLQLLMLYARKSDREYSQLLVLSLLQMISASVLSISMIYGLFLAAYCVVALITVLLFHLTTTADRVYQANLVAAGPRATRPDTQITTEARRQLRGTAAVVGLICAVIAAAVFVTLPRTGSSSLDLSPTTRRAPIQTGFSNVVRLGAGPIGTGSREPMLNLSIFSDGQPIGHRDEPWLVRGAALDQYNPDNRTWARSHYAAATDQVYALETLNQQLDDWHTSRSVRYTAEIAIRDARQRTLFSVVATPYRFGIPAFHPQRIDSQFFDDIVYNRLDKQLQAAESSVAATTYRITWPLTPPRDPDYLAWPTHPWEVNPDREPGHATGGRAWRRSPDGTRMLRRPDPQYEAEAPEPIDRGRYARQWKIETQRVRDFALRIIRQRGLDRDPQADATPDDLKIASTLSDYLRTHYTYDLNNPSPRGGQDPVIQFLFDRRRGHCELFAAGLAALCRSINIPARLITGFRASEYNALGGYYVVRQSNAHAWVEVYGGHDRGWYTFDATPPAEVEAEHSPPEGWLASIRGVYEHVEFAWLRTVVAFDSRTRKAVIDKVGRSTGQVRRDAEHWLEAKTQQLLQLSRKWHVGGTEVALFGLAALGLTLAGAIFLRLRLIRRRRLARLQVDRLPAEKRRRLGRQLHFYLDMLDILERHGHHRPAWQSPRAFAVGLARQSPDMHEPVVDLTEVFYRIRFGHRTLDEELRQRIHDRLTQLEQAVAEPRRRLP
jgi:transglutaminase-like putative cysteine protease